MATGGHFPPAGRGRGHPPRPEKECLYFGPAGRGSLPTDPGVLGLETFQKIHSRNRGGDGSAAPLIPPPGMGRVGTVWPGRSPPRP